MLLAVDIGNTNIVFGIHDGIDWLNHWRIRTVRDKMPDEYAVLFREFLREAGQARVQMQASGQLPAFGYTFDQVVLSSVVPPLTGRMEEMLTAQTGIQPLIVNHKINTGLRFAVDNPQEVGADLIANAVAAYERFHTACIAVDFGTATTFTAVSADAVFLGVAIAPGVNLAAAALAGGTAQLPQIQIAPPPNPIGTNTVHAIQSGIVLGYVGLIEAIIKRFCEQIGHDVPVAATGGLARLIAPLTQRFAVVDEWLTLEGVRLIALRNA
ncbi:MAG: type III pantothenate kinase [Anaerolineae bacterium]|nr:type III pantothenate kinase [Anaerolineae bacterium]